MHSQLYAFVRMVSGFLQGFHAAVTEKPRGRKIPIAAEARYCQVTPVCCQSPHS